MAPRKKTSPAASTSVKGKRGGAKPKIDLDDAEELQASAAEEEEEEEGEEEEEEGEDGDDDGEDGEEPEPAGEPAPKMDGWLPKPEQPPAQQVAASLPEEAPPVFDGPPAYAEPPPYMDPTLFGAADADDPLPLFAHDMQNPLDPEKVELLALYKYNSAREPEIIDQIENTRITDIELRNTILERGYGAGVYAVNARAFRNHRVLRWGKPFRVSLPPVTKLPGRSGHAPYNGGGNGGGNGHSDGPVPAHTLDAKGGIVIPGSNNPMESTLIWMQKQEAARALELKAQREEMKADRERMEVHHRQQLEFLEKRMVQQVSDVQIQARAIMERNSRPINEDVVESIREQRDKLERQNEEMRRDLEKLKESQSKAERDSLVKQLDKNAKDMDKLREEIRNAPDGGGDSEPTMASVMQQMAPTILPAVMRRLGLDVPTEGTVPESG